MPFRAKAKNLFKTKSSRSDSTSKSSTTNSDRERYPSNVYRPDERMPPPKYRAAPKKEHTEALEAFSFANSWRKKSFNSTYSPMGTRAPSRRNSWLSRKSFARSRPGSFGNEVPDGTGPSGGVKHREGMRMPAQEEQEGDDDVTNVGLSRVQSHKGEQERKLVSRDRNINGIAPALPTVTAHDHQPFSENDLSLALQRSHLAVAAQS